MAEQIRICVTGHRPGRLYGYDLLDPRWKQLSDKLQEILTNERCTEAISGMALGVDTVFALAVLDLKEKGYPITLHCAVPCRGQDSRWNAADKRRYRDICGKADKVVYVSDSSYNVGCMQRRNMYMVDHADKVLAVWDGGCGGTKNCIEYAKQKGKEILLIAP